ncbi:MAG TPA: 50S ribosomal protein L30 [Chloroflexota bacterium]|jgi:large subunit ribosomal protein L30|nr:50S ribosomal protein L30 [Chloroflexota bacterium]
MTSGRLRIQLVRSLIGHPADQRAAVRALGLRRIRHTVERDDTPAVRGLIAKVQHLVKVEKVEPA